MKLKFLKKEWPAGSDIKLVVGNNSDGKPISMTDFRGYEDAVDLMMLLEVIVDAMVIISFPGDKIEEAKLALLRSTASVIERKAKYKTNSSHYVRDLSDEGDE